MIVCQISEASRYLGLGEGLATAIKWLMENYGNDFVKGQTVIGSCNGADITVKCEEPALLPREKAALEAHRKYIDIHVPLKGSETIGWAPVCDLKHVREPYDEDKDIAFYGDSAQSLLHLKPGQMAVMFPDDAHAPNIGLGNHRKLCIKIQV